MKSKRILTAIVFASLFTAGVQAAPSPADMSPAVRHVWFTKQLNDIQLAGNLYMPPNFKPGKAYSAIVVVHPGGGVKEQTAGIYAQKLA